MTMDVDQLTAIFT